MRIYIIVALASLLFTSCTSGAMIGAYQNAAQRNSGSTGRGVGSLIGAPVERGGQSQQGNFNESSAE